MEELIYTTLVLSVIIIVWVGGRYLIYTLVNSKPDTTSKFSIEHYPLTNRYYPMYKDKYLDRCRVSGMVKIERVSIRFATYFDSEDKAKSFIKEFKLNTLKESVTTINLKD